MAYENEILNNSINTMTTSLDDLVEVVEELRVCMQMQFGINANLQNRVMKLEEKGELDPQEVMDCIDVTALADDVFDKLDEQQLADNVADQIKDQLDIPDAGDIEYRIIDRIKRALGNL